jgi:hypothetical protein
VAVAEDCVFVVVKRTVSAAGVDAIRRAFERVEAEHARIGYVSFIHADGVRAMDAAARDLMTKVLRKYTRHIEAAAMIVDGTGFRGTVVRSVLTAIHMASNASHPLRCFSAPEPALAWYREKRPTAKLDNAAIERVLRELVPRVP